MLLDTREIWKNVLKEAAKDLKKSHFLTWFKDTALFSLNKEQAVIGVPNVFARDWLKDKYEQLLLKLFKVYAPEIKEIIYEVSQALFNNSDRRKIDVKKVADDSISEKKARKVREKMEVRLIEGITSKLLNPKYSLDNFVVGPENRLAHAACSAVSEHPGGAYNPLFLYGGVGLGKTHLLQAVGNEILSQNPEVIVVYSPSEKFINEIVEAIGNRHTKEFREKYRKVDCLIVDDIQFFAQKDTTQIEFFHTFNEVFEANKQIILSSDRPPKELTLLHDRLRSRFEMGMIVDVQFPGYETRLAILQQKCRERQILIDPEVLEFIAYNVRESVRELEGILLQAIAQAELENRVPTLKSVADMMVKLDKKLTPQGAALSGNKKLESLSIDDLIDITTNYYRVNRADLLSESRKKEISVPRQVCMYLIRTELNQSYERIGKDFGGKNHTTVMHACEKIIKELKRNSHLVRDINAIKKEMGR